LLGSKLGKMLLCSAPDENKASSIFDTNKATFETLDSSVKALAQDRKMKHVFGGLCRK